MQIDEKELERRLGSKKNLANTLLPPRSNITDIPAQSIPSVTDNPIPVIHDDTKVISIQKADRAPKLDTNTRIMAGVLGHQMPAREIAAEMNITVGQVNGAKNTKDPSIAIPRQKALDKIQELALDKMMYALGLMTPDKFQNASLKELSIVTANMARLVESTSPNGDSDTRVQLVIYAPEVKNEKSYKIMDV